MKKLFKLIDWKKLGSGFWDTLFIYIAVALFYIWFYSVIFGEV